MKKYLFPLLMSLTILAGVSLVLTPYIAEWLLPAESSTYRAAPESEVKQAMSEWFKTEVPNVGEVQGLHRTAPDGNTSWFKFKLPRQSVEQFIRANHLQQKPLTAELMNTTFSGKDLPAPWWQPAELKRETCFVMASEDQQMGLIYNAELEQGYLVVRSRTKTHSF